MVFIENFVGSLYLERETDVYRYALIFDHLRAKALDPDDSRRLFLLLVRDSKDPDGPVLALTPEGWDAFLASIKSGHLPDLA